MKSLIEKASDIAIKQSGLGTHCVLSLLDHEGYPTTSTITVSKADGIKDIYFCTGLESNKSLRIKKNNQASVCFNSEDYNITLVGNIDIQTNEAIKKEMWYGGLENHFSGPEDSQYCVLHFKTKRYNILIDWQELQGKF